jgi:hypothetical protein
MSKNSVQEAHNLFSKALDYGRHGKGAEEKAAYDEIIKRFGDAEEPKLKEQVSRVPADRGVSYHF